MLLPSKPLSPLTPPEKAAVNLHKDIDDGRQCVPFLSIDWSEDVFDYGDGPAVMLGIHGREGTAEGIVGVIRVGERNRRDEHCEEGDSDEENGVE